MKDLDTLVNGKQLAALLGRHETWVIAMKKAGYVFQYPALKKTTLRHALKALSRAPSFVADYYHRKGWETDPRCTACLADRPRPKNSNAGKSDSPAPYAR
jgi:hypothetical protein